MPELRVAGTDLILSLLPLYEVLRVREEAEGDTSRAAEALVPLDLTAAVPRDGPTFL